MIELTSNRMSRGRHGVGGVGTMPSGEEEGATSGATRGSSVMDAALGLLWRGGRASGCPLVRKAASGVAGEANRRRRSSGDALKTKTIDEEEERREAAVYTRGTFSPGSIHRPRLKHL